MKLSPIILLALAVLGLAIFGYYERSQGAKAVQAQARADSLQRASDSLKAAIVGREAQFAQDSLKRAQDALRASQRLRTAARRADSLGAILAADTSPTMPTDSVRLIISAKDSQYQALAVLDSLRQAALITLQGQVAFWRDTVVVSLTKTRDAAQGQLQAALKKSARRWFFPCAAGPIAGNSRGVGLGLALGICYAF